LINVCKQRAPFSKQINFPNKMKMEKENVIINHRLCFFLFWTEL
jgi:hypothetical protein